MNKFFRLGFKRSYQALMLILVMGSQFASANDFDALTQELLVKDFDVKAVAIDKLAKMQDERVKPLFVALTQSKIYYIKKTKQIGYYEVIDKKINFQTILTGESISDLSKRKYKKVTTNNALRGRFGRALV